MDAKCWPGVARGAPKNNCGHALYEMEFLTSSLRFVI